MNRFNLIRLFLLAAVIGCGIGTMGRTADADPKPPKELASFKAPNGNNLDWAQFTQDGKFLAVASSYGPGGDLKIIEIPSGKEKKTKATEGFGIGTLATAGDAKVFLTANSDKEHVVRLWDLATDKSLKTFKLDSRVFDVRVSPDGKLVACSHSSGRDFQDDNKLTVFDVATGKAKGTFDSNGTLAFSPDGSVLAYATQKDFAIKIYDLKQGKEKHVFKGHKSFVRFLLLTEKGTLVSNTGTVVLVGDKEDKSVRFWDVETGKQKASLDCPEVVDSLTLGPDGKTVLTTHDKAKTVCLWDIDTAKSKGDFQPSNRERVWHLVFTPDGKTMITTHYDKGIILWDYPANKKRLELKALDEYCLKPAITRDGKLMVLAHKDGTIKLYDLKP